MTDELKEAIQRATNVEDPIHFVLIAGNANGQVGINKEGSVFLHVGFLEILKQKLIGGMNVAPGEATK